jgi:hypothetical protein
MLQQLLAVLILWSGTLFGMWFLVRFIRATPKSALQSIWSSEKVKFWVINLVISGFLAGLIFIRFPNQGEEVAWPLFAPFVLFMLLAASIYNSSKKLDKLEWLICLTPLIPGIIFFVLFKQMKGSAQA